MIQTVLLFLILIAVLGVGAKWLRLPPKRLPSKRRRQDPALHAAARCPICRAFVIGEHPKPCSRTNCPYR